MEVIFEKELDWLSERDFNQLLRFWGIEASQEKKRTEYFEEITLRSQNRYLLLNSLEGLSKIELKILLYVAEFPDGCTLGEISKKLFIPPQTLEVELQSLRQFGFVYLRRNRERLTNIRDKYYLFDHLRGQLNIPQRLNRENFFIRSAKDLFGPDVDLSMYQANHLQGVLEKIGETGTEILEKAFANGGILDVARMKDSRGDQTEQLLLQLHEEKLAGEVVFFDNEMFRFLVLPQELINPWGETFYYSNRSFGAAAEYLGFDFVLNLKKTLFFIQSKGALLTQALRLKLADNRKLAQSLIPAKLDPISPIKLVDQLDFILPVLRLLEVLEIQDYRLALTAKFQDFIGKSPVRILQEIIDVIFEKGDKVGFYEEIFNPIDMPFFSEDDFDTVLTLMKEEKAFGLTWLLTQYLQAKVFLPGDFVTGNLRKVLQTYERKFIHTVFYLFLFGFITYEKKENDIYLSVSRIGRHFLNNDLESLEKEYFTACLFFNPDMTIIIDKNQASEMVLYIMKAFTKIEDENQVLTLSLNRDTFQQGVMIGFTPKVFTDTILSCFKTPLPQNVEYFLQEWSKNIQIATISHKTIIQVKDKEVLDNLIQQPKLKPIFEERLGDTAAIVAEGQDQNLIMAAEKLNIIIKLFN